MQFSTLFKIIKIDITTFRMNAFQKFARVRKTRGVLKLFLKCGATSVPLFAFFEVHFPVSIKNNKSVDKNSIELIGNNNTVTLKDEGIVVGKIKEKKIINMNQALYIDKKILFLDYKKLSMLP